MKKSINFQSIGVVILLIFVFNFIMNIIRAIMYRKQNVIQQQTPPTVEPQPEKTVIKGFQPEDPQDKFFVKEDETENT